MALVWDGLRPREQASERTGVASGTQVGADMDLRRLGGLCRGRCGPVKIGLYERGHCRHVDRLRPGRGDCRLVSQG